MNLILTVRNIEYVGRVEVHAVDDGMVFFLTDHLGRGEPQPVGCWTIAGTWHSIPVAGSPGLGNEVRDAMLTDFLKRRYWTALRDTWSSALPHLRRVGEAPTATEEDQERLRHADVCFTLANARLGEDSEVAEAIRTFSDGWTGDAAALVTAARLLS